MQKLPADVTMHSHFNCLGCHAGSGSQGLLEQDSFHAAPRLWAGQAGALMSDDCLFRASQPSVLLGPGLSRGPAGRP